MSLAQRLKPHRGHAFCGSLCVPHFLFDEFQQCLGPRAEEFDLLSWMVNRDKMREHEQGVVEEPLTWWRDAFKAELRARGWTSPKPKPSPIAPRTVSPAAPRVTPQGYRYPCFHSPPCPNTWSCCQRQREDQDEPPLVKGFGR